MLKTIGVLRRSVPSEGNSKDQIISHDRIEKKYGIWMIHEQKLSFLTV